MLHCTKTCTFSIQHKCQINGQFFKRVTKIFVLLNMFGKWNRKKCKHFLSIYYRNSASKCCCISVDIPIALRVLQYVSYRMTAVSSQPYFRGKVWFNQILTRCHATAIIRQANYIDCTKWYDGSWNSLKAKTCTVNVLKF